MSTTLQPLVASLGAQFFEISWPAEKRAKSTSLSNKSIKEIISCDLPSKKIYFPHDFSEATGISSVKGSYLSESTSNNSLPTIPVTPTIANFIS